MRFVQPEEVADDDVRLLKWTTYDATHVPVDYDGDTPINQVRALFPPRVFLFSLSDNLSNAVPVLMAV